MLFAPSTSPSRRYNSHPSLGRDFLHFLFRLVRLVFVPIVFPLQLLQRILTAPLTVSLLLKLVLLLLLSLASLVLSVLAVGAFFWTWSAGGPIEVEGWLVYGKFRLPHTNLQVPLSSILEDVRYDIQVEMELLRPRKGPDELVPLRKDLMEGVFLKPSRTPESVVGSVSLHIGREDSFVGDSESEGRLKEVKTTGWVLVRFIPRPSGIRWLISVHPLPALLLLPPLSLLLALLSSIFGCAMITIIRRKPKPSKSPKSLKALKAHSGSHRIRDYNARSGQEGPERHSRVQDRAVRTRRSSNYTDVTSSTYSESKIPTENANSASTSEIGDRHSIIISDDESTSSQ
ncbi:hypothetical protein D1P53_005883 [Cryptococcus gattii VGV]|nr:hypothetical protein D1P53_005883 [Cryptococcus gattii VGV]